MTMGAAGMMMSAAAHPAVMVALIVLIVLLVLQLR